MARKMIERSHATATIEYIRWRYPYAITFKIQNEGKRYSARAEGILAGMSDIGVLWPVGNYHGLFIEMKRPDIKSRISDKQIEMGKRIIAAGYAFAFCAGVDEAIRIADAYFSNNLNCNELTCYPILIT